MRDVDDEAAVAVVVGQLEVKVPLVLVDVVDEKLELSEGYKDEWLAADLVRRVKVVPVSRSASASDAGSQMMHWLGRK